MSDWWDDMLAECEADGAKDAESGAFDPPYPGSDDEQDLAMNRAYQRGFNQRRKELGDKFRWV